MKCDKNVHLSVHCSLLSHMHMTFRLLPPVKEKLTLSGNVYKRVNKTQAIKTMSHKVYIFEKQINWKIYFCYGHFRHLTCVYTVIEKNLRVQFSDFFTKTVDSTFFYYSS